MATQPSARASFPALILRKGIIKDEVYTALRAAILDGRLRTGSKIPSSRALTETMGVSRNSILRGVERLVDEGYLVTRRGAGTFVSDSLPDLSMTAPQRPAAACNEEAIVTHINPDIWSLLPRWRQIRPDASHNPLFSIGVGCVDLFPHAIWGRLLGRVWRTSSRQIGHLPDPAGYAPLRAAISDYVQTTRGLHCTPEQVIIVNGTQQAMNLTAQVLLKRGDKVWLDEPGYDGAYGAFCAQGYQVCPIPSDGQGMDLAYATQHYLDAQLAFTTPSHQFPLGGTMELSRRLALLAWAETQQRWILEDDYNSEFRYQSRPIQALQGLDKRGRVVYAGTFTKVMYPEFRLGFLVVPNALTEVFSAAKYYADTRSAWLEQAVLAEFIREGHYARHVRRVRRACYERQQTLIQAIQHSLSDKLKVKPTDSGIHLLCELVEGVQEEAVIAACRAAGLGIQPLSRYCQQPGSAPAILLGFAAHPPQELIEGVRLLANIV